MLSVVILNVIFIVMLNVVMLSVVILSVVAPTKVSLNLNLRDSLGRHDTQHNDTRNKGTWYNIKYSITGHSLCQHY
jgi:hypothetical protein